MLKSRLEKLKLLIKQFGFYMPFSHYLLLFVLAALLGYRWLQQTAAIPDSSYKAIFTLLLSFALLLGNVILCLGCLSVAIAFVFFKWQQKKNRVSLRVFTSRNGETSEARQDVALYIHPILQPFLGYIKIRLNYDETHFSKKFNLVKQQQVKLFNTTLEGTYHWSLPEIREYRIEKVIIYFEDFFQFFSFATPVLASNNFYTPPQAQVLKKIEAFPRKTEEQTTRIEELKKVEGEYINYKNFESNDDVRRIVWKIYAKNKELVVRIPEVLDPYASHIYLYASFFSTFNVQGSDVVEVPFLNYYKTLCWSLYQQFAKKGFEVRYIADQDVPPGNMPDEEDRVKFAITVSSWQNQKDLKAYVKPKDAAVVLVSSLSDAAEVKALLEKYGNEISFVFVALTNSLNNLQLGHWLQWLFVQQEKDKTMAYRTAWNLSPLRLKIEKNEKELMQLMKDYEKSFVL